MLIQLLLDMCISAEVSYEAETERKRERRGEQKDWKHYPLTMCRKLHIEQLGRNTKKNIYISLSVCFRCVCIYRYIERERVQSVDLIGLKHRPGIFFPAMW